MHHHGVMILARFIRSSSFSTPIFGSKMAAKEQFAMLSVFIQMTVVTGLLAADMMYQIPKYKNKR